MLNDLVTLTGEPSNAGTLALRKALAMQPPTEVPAKGAPWTDAEVTLPLGAKVTLTLPLPVGPSAFLQLRAAPAAAPSAEEAAPRLNSLPPSAGAAAAVSAGLVSVGLLSVGFVSVFASALGLGEVSVLPG